MTQIKYSGGLSFKPWETQTFRGPKPTMEKEQLSKPVGAGSVLGAKLSKAFQKAEEFKKSNV